MNRDDEGLRVELKEGSRTVVVGGELDMGTVPQLTAYLDELLRSPGDITLDLTTLSFIDSSGIRALLQTSRRLKGKGNVVLRGPGAHVSRVLEMVGLDAVEGLRIEPAGGQ